MKKLDRTWRSHFLRAIVTLRGSPEAIALGTAIGTFVAFSPTVGFQMILAALIATFVRANRPAAILATWIASPLTLAPIFALTYRVGAAVVGLPTSGKEYQRFVDLIKSLDAHTLSEYSAFAREIVGLGGSLMLSLWVGGLVMGAFCALVMYPVVLWMGRRFRGYKDARRLARALKMRSMLY